MRFFGFVVLFALALPACKTRVEPMTRDQFRVVLREQGLGDPYVGAATTPMGTLRLYWITALRGDDPVPVETVTFFRDEPVWEDAWWTHMTASLDSSLTADGWTPLANEVGLEYVCGWTRGAQRLAVGRVPLYSDSTSYITATLAGPRAE